MLFGISVNLQQPEQSRWDRRLRFPMEDGIVLSFVQLFKLNFTSPTKRCKDEGSSFIAVLFKMSTFRFSIVSLISVLLLIKSVSKALYTFDIGQNDLTAGYKLNMTTEQVKAYIPDVLGQFSNVIESVYKEGARSFWIHNTGPLGCLPYMLDRYPMSAAQIDKFGCATPFNEVAQYFNHKLKEIVVKLREELSEATVVYVDVYTVKYTLISHAQKYGFENGVIACCGHGGKYNFNNIERCGATKIVNGEKIVIANSCKDPSVKIIWDGIHYTEAANKWIFQQIVNGHFSEFINQ
ncbi:GDSL esterase/lipase [Trifolium repens]|nr:GDSL esterase/lipase [Trifolium repens]